MFRCRKQKGFSVIEVIITLVLLLIISLLIIPAVETYYAQNRLKGAAENLYDHVMLARTTAIKTSTAVTLSFFTGSSWCYGMTSGVTACNCNTGTPACSLGVTNNTDFPNTSINATSPASITFNATRGVPITVPTNPIKFDATSGQSITITINAMGAAKVCSSTVGGYEC